MKNPTKDQLSNWLENVQDYPVSDDNSARLLNILDNVKHTLGTVKEGSLFWTEPAGLITVFTNTKDKESEK